MNSLSLGLYIGWRLMPSRSPRNTIRPSLTIPCRIISSDHSFIHTAGHGLLFCACVMLVGCVSVRVEPLTHESYPPRNNHAPVQWLESEPGAPHINLARIIATSQTADEDQMRDKILARAESMGADAVVLGRSDVLESMMGPSPLYESTLGPTADSFSPYASGWGWWNPFYYDPWSFVQGAADQTGRTELLTGTAIRYVDGK